jgi:ABC-type nitrate/sulfonate/bicarbonate transport system substrate-binding protein
MKSYPNLIVSSGHFHAFHRVAPVVALQRGYFKQEGLKEIDIMTTGDDESTMVGLRRASIHIHLDVKPSMVFHERNKGEKVYIIGAMLGTHPVSFIGAKGIKSIKELKGKKIGLYESGGGASRHMITALLRKHGLDPDKDVSYMLRAGSPSLKVQASRLDRGDYQANTVFSVYAPEALKQGYTVFAHAQDVYPDGYPTRVIATIDYLVTQHPDALKAFLRGLVRGYRFVREKKNVAKVWKVIKEWRWEKAKNFGWDEGFDPDWLKKGFLYPNLAVDARVPVKGLERMMEELKSSGELPKSFSLEQVIRLDFLEEAIKEVDSKFGQGKYE